jgi:large subunit ribosomal protein L6e
VNQAYTLSTSTRINVAGVKLDSISDETFAHEATARRTRSQRFFAKDAPKTSTSDARKKLQKEVDTAILKNITDRTERRYLGARFSLTRNDAPHAMKY